jgi:hypothetical protein
MAIKPLNERLDDLSGAEKAQAEMPMDNNSQETFELTTEPPQFEETQVAGIKDIAEIILKAPKRTKKPLVKEGESVSQVGPYQVIKEAPTQVTEQIVQEAPKMPVSGKPSAEPGVQETAFNLDLIKDEDGVKQFIESTARTYGADKLEKISYKEVAAKAAEDGYDEAFLARIIDPNAPTLADPTQAYKMLLAITDAGKRAFDLGNKVAEAKKAGTLTADLASEFQQAVALEGTLLKASRGRQADIARTLGIFSEARQSSATRGEVLDALMNEAGGIESVHDFATKYIALDSRGARADLAANSYGNDWRGVGTRLKDIWFSTWINGLLSSPVTHAKNIAGNTFFGAYQIPERMVASLIGKTRNMIFQGGEQAIQLNEVQAQAIGFLQGIREGGSIAIDAFKKNTPTDAFSKIEDVRAGKAPFDWDMGDSDFGQAMSKGLRMYGTFVTAPGRALMAEDEFFKAVTYRMELNALAVREGNKMFDTLVSKGVDADSARKQSGDLVSSLLANPTAEIDEAAKFQARTTTFTRELEPALQKVASATQSPFIKIFVPFIKTPTNIMMETVSRSPAAFMSPRFLNDFKAGGVKRDMAMARVALGTGVMYSVAAGPLEGRLTGYGPMRTGDKEVLEGTGWQQFSAVFNKEEVSDDLLAKFSELTQVKVGSNKVYVSYAGLEPLATLLAIGATAGEYSMQDANEQDMSKLFSGGVMGMYTYMGDQPALQGISDIHKIFTSKANDPATHFYNVMSRVSKAATSFAIGGSPMGVHSSFVANIERMVNPEKSLVMEAINPENINAEGGVSKGFWEAVGYAKSRNPLTSDDLPPALDSLTGVAKKTGEGNWNETFNPFKMSNGKYSDAHLILAEFGIPMYRPSKKMDGVELTDQQYTRLIELATEGDRIEKGLLMYAKDDAFRNYAKQDLKGAQNTLSQIITDAYSDAKKRLLMEDVDLKLELEDIKQYQREEGKYKR